jgi:hypothetical protein
VLSVMILTHHLRKDTSISSTSVLGLSSRSFRMQSGLRRLGRRLYAPIDQRARRRRPAPPLSRRPAADWRDGRRQQRWWVASLVARLHFAGAAGQRGRRRRGG